MNLVKRTIILIQSLSLDNSLKTDSGGFDEYLEITWICLFSKALVKGKAIPLQTQTGP